MRRFALEQMRPHAEAADDAGRPPEALLAAAAELGLVMLAVPEAHGGAAEERSVTTWALIASELARGDLGLAFALLSPVSVAHLLVDHATETQRAAWLPALAAESFSHTSAAFLERGPLFDPQVLNTRATPRRGGFQLRGEKALVALGRSARSFLVSAQRPEGGPGLFFVEADQPGVEVVSTPAMGMRAADLCTLRLDVELGSGALLGEGEHDAQRVIDLARVGWGALAVGQGRAVLEHAMSYCDQRVAFGEPITHRQSVAFMLADLAIELDGLELMVWRAAARADAGLPFTRAAHLVHAQAGPYAMKVGTDGVQLLGGAGFVREHPVERWYRHLRAVGVMEGGLCL